MTPIPLFHIPTHQIDTSKYSNLLHDRTVTQFEENFCEYVGCKYGVALNSATNAIFLLFLNQNVMAEIPTLIPPVVANAIVTANNRIRFNDNHNWVGGSYILSESADKKFKIIDSAQRVDRDQFKLEANDNDLMIFSFYPTKPISGCDGGMICSNDKAYIDYIRTLAYNGMTNEPNNWERKQSMVGYKMYMNSIQAEIANKNLRDLQFKKNELERVRMLYNRAFGLNNTGDHLYRVQVKNADEFIAKAKVVGIICGKHYATLHTHPLFLTGQVLPLSDHAARTMVSIPFHEALGVKDIETVIKFVEENRNI